MPDFIVPMFAAAGALAAAGPVIIHLLNRRRFRVVDWAAMDFLREALQRNRRILQLRDLLLLALRTLCVLLFGLAMARPFFRAGDASFDPDQPVHAVLVIDNSLSMAYEKLDGTLLDEARARAAEFIDRLPEGSRISIIPLCGPSDGFSWDPFRTKEDARRALDRVAVVDRTGTAAQAIDLARQAYQQAVDVPSKRVVFIGDQQAVNWPSSSLADAAGELPELQVVAISGSRTGFENAWIDDFRLQDGIADVETPATFLATVRYEGDQPRPNVQVTLNIDGVPAASRTIDLEDGQTAEVQFSYRFDVAPEPGQPTFVAAEVSLSPDRLPADDRRVLMAPVVAALPVVFVDQLGRDEDPHKNLYGETFLLRRLLAPITTQADYPRQPIRIEHRRIDELDQSVLEDARLVVIAGVSRPDPSVELLRQYVEQGGQLVIAAGGAFDPVAWTDDAWLDGAGILPAPLEPDLVGRLPGAGSDPLDVFQLSPTSMVHDYFVIEGEDRQLLEDLYSTPVFFQAVAADVSDDVLAELEVDEIDRITELRTRLAAKAQQEAGNGAAAGPQAAVTNGASAHGTDEDTNTNNTYTNGSALDEPDNPTWLLWSSASDDGEDNETSPAELAQRTQPRVLARFSNQVPFAVQRKIGRGQVLWFGTGALAYGGSGTSGWNNLCQTDAVLMFDRAFRAMINETLPRRNLQTLEKFTLPVTAADRRDRFELVRPGGAIEPLTLDALGADRYGLTVRELGQRGVYHVTAHRPETAELEGFDARHWDVALAVNGTAQESELAAIEESAAREQLGETNFRWITGDGTISLEGAQVSGQNLWTWFMWSVLALLLFELVVLAWPLRGKEAAQ